MNNKKNIKRCFIGLSISLTLLTGYLFLKTNKQYHYGDYVKEKNAYFAKEIEDETGFIKAHKFVTPTDNKYNSQKTRSLGSGLIGDIESVWSSYTGKGTTIAIIDDGFDVNHPEYLRSDGTSAILPESRSYFVNGNYLYYSQFSDESDCLDEDWETSSSGSAWATHGTCTSTTAAAPMNNGGGVGIAPDANILALKIDMSFAAIDAAIDYAVSLGVDAINMSLGAYAETFTDGWGDEQSFSSAVATYLEPACQAAYNAGVIVVAAAGNESTYHKSYPACNKKVIGVGAIGDWDNKGNANELAEFTNYVDPEQTGEINVDILAPGYVYTAYLKGTKSSPTHTYDDIQGTSFSSPIIAGAACLWKQKYPNGTPDQFLEQLQQTADGIGYYTNKMIPVSGWNPSLSDVGPSYITNGRLNVAKLMEIDEPFVSTKQSSLSLAIGESHQIDLDTYNGAISYSSNNTNVATVSGTGVVQGIGAGDTTITVTATKNNHIATTTVDIHISSIVATTSLTINPNSISLDIGETYNVEPTITLTPSNASRIMLFESENEDIASIDEDTGVITAIKEGTATINACAIYGSGEDSLTVTVTDPTPKTLSSISISGYTTSLEVGEDYSFGGVVTAHYSDSTSEDVTSSATFSGYDMSTAGEYTVTVSYTFGGSTKTASYTLTVTSPSVITGSVSYTVSTKNSASVSSGSAPSGTSVGFNNNGSNNADQMVNGKKETWTLNGYKDYVLTSLSARLHKNSSSGSGTVSLTNNSVSVSVVKSAYSSSDLTSSYKSYEILPDNLTVNGTVVLTLTSTANSFWCDGITITYEKPDTSDKIISNLVVQYSGGDVYVGDSLNESSVSVTANFTKSDKYPSVLLDSADYSLSGFSSMTAGVKTVTVQYIGSLPTATSPLTTSFNVNVITDTVSSVSVTNNKTYHPGETISKGDITVTLTHISGKQTTTTNFTFEDDGYMFTYEDASSGGSISYKQFSIRYDSQLYYCNVKVTRVDYQTISGSTTQLSSSQFASSTLSKSSSTPSNTSVTIGGIGFTVTTNAYVFTSSNVNYISFGKGVGRIYNTNAFNADLTSVSVTVKSGSRQDGQLLISKDGNNWMTYSSLEVVKGGYRYFKYEFATAKTGSGASNYSNIQSISFSLAGIDNPVNVANYIMFEDTINQCNSKLDIAISRLNTMSNDDKQLFWTSDSYVIAKARERIIAWAIALGHDLQLNNGNYTLSKLNKVFVSFDNSSSSSILLVALTMSLIAVGGYLILKKRKTY